MRAFPGIYHELAQQKKISMNVGQASQISGIYVFSVNLKKNQIMTTYLCLHPRFLQIIQELTRISG